jgi:hypothetical protein
MPATSFAVAGVTICGVTVPRVGRWLVVWVRLPSGQSSKHRVAVWRELRKVGAVPLGGGVWATPAAPVFAAGVQRVAELVDRASGQVLMLDAQPHGPGDETVLQAEFNAARIEEWREFISECDKYEAEIAKERRIGKLTVAELDEEEQSLERLRRWFRELKARDIFAVPEGADADVRLKRCAEVLDDYADEVYQAVHAPLGREDH